MLQYYNLLILPTWRVDPIVSHDIIQQGISKITHIQSRKRNCPAMVADNTRIIVVHLSASLYNTARATRYITAACEVTNTTQSIAFTRPVLAWHSPLELDGDNGNDADNGPT